MVKSRTVPLVSACSVDVPDIISEVVSLKDKGCKDPKLFKERTGRKKQPAVVPGFMLCAAFEPLIKMPDVAPASWELYPTTTAPAADAPDSAPMQIVLVACPVYPAHTPIAMALEPWSKYPAHDPSATANAPWSVPPALKPTAIAAWLWPEHPAEAPIATAYCDWLAKPALAPTAMANFC
jgi:hypothetical protein